jgi:hypothetical protein
VVSDGGGRNAHEGSDAGPAQPEPYISTDSASGARRNRLSMMDPILPSPSPAPVGHGRSTDTAFGRPLAVGCRVHGAPSQSSGPPGPVVSTTMLL